MSSDDNIDIEDVLVDSVGRFGRWQLYTTAIIFLVKVSLPWHQLGIVFLAPPTRFQCAVNTTDACSPECPAHEFDRSVFTETIISEWDLVCDKEQLANVAQLVFMLGILTGNTVFGYLSDRYGRRNPLVCAVLLQVVTGVATAFIPWFWVFVVCRFLCAVATGGTMLTSFVLLMEITPEEHRMLLGILFQLPTQGGFVFMGYLGYLLRDWRHFQIAASAPSIVLVSCYWLLPESPRWLLSVGRTQHAVHVLQRAARLNGLPPADVEQHVHRYLQHVPKEQQREGRLADLFGSREIRRRSACVCVNWLLLGMGFFGAAQYMGRIRGNIFVNVALSGLVQILGGALVFRLLRQLSRRRTLQLTYAFAALSCLALLLVPAEYHWLVALLGVCDVMAIAMSFTVMYIYAGELYPTVIRNLGLGMASMFARIGSMAAPFVASLHDVLAYLPPLFFGLAPLACVLALSFLPETRGKKLPDTVEQVKMAEVAEALQKELTH